MFISPRWVASCSAALQLSPVSSVMQMPWALRFFIRAGEFRFGNYGHRRDEANIAVIYNFKISKYEITNLQYALFLEEYGDDKDSLGNFLIFNHEWGLKKEKKKWVVQEGYENHPVINVTWYGAKAFAEFYGYRLPTEAEWEFACRGGTETDYYFGNDPLDLDEYAWHRKNAGNSTNRVGQKKPNQYGLYDMYGNAGEWCFDWFLAQYGPRKNMSNPQGPGIGVNKVVRGGNWTLTPKNIHSTSRTMQKPSEGSNLTGFRIILPEDEMLVK